MAKPIEPIRVGIDVSKAELVDGYRLNRYRDGIGNRAKTDPADARLILRYLSKELSELKPWVPPHEAFYRIQSLLRRRASLVHTRVALTQKIGRAAGRERGEMRGAAGGLEQK